MSIPFSRRIEQDMYTTIPPPISSEAANIGTQRSESEGRRRAGDTPLWLVLSVRYAVDDVHVSGLPYVKHRSGPTREAAWRSGTAMAW